MGDVRRLIAEDYDRAEVEIALVAFYSGARGILKVLAERATLDSPQPRDRA